MPSHIQIERVLEGTLDAAIAWAPAPTSGSISACCGPNRCTRSPPLAGPQDPCAPPTSGVLVDADLTSWDAWNRFAEAFAATPGPPWSTSTMAGSPARASTSVAASWRPGAAVPQAQSGTLPAGLRTGPVRDPTPLWCWSLVTRNDDDRPAVADLRADAASLTRVAGLHVRPAGPWWAPAEDPLHEEVRGLPPLASAAA